MRAVRESGKNITELRAKLGVPIARPPGDSGTDELAVTKVFLFGNFLRLPTRKKVHIWLLHSCFWHPRAIVVTFLFCFRHPLPPRRCHFLVLHGQPPQPPSLRSSSPSPPRRTSRVFPASSPHSLLFLFFFLLCLHTHDATATTLARSFRLINSGLPKLSSSLPSRPFHRRVRDKIHLDFREICSTSHWTPYPTSHNHPQTPAFGFRVGHCVIIVSIGKVLSKKIGRVDWTVHSINLFEFFL